MLNNYLFIIYSDFLQSFFLPISATIQINSGKNIYVLKIIIYTFGKFFILERTSDFRPHFGLFFVVKAEDWPLCIEPD